MRRAIEHPADIAFELEANTREELFQEALAGLAESLTGKEVIASTAGEERIIRSEGFDDEEMLVGLLNELIFLAQFGRFGIEGIGAVNFQGKNIVEAVVSGSPDGGGEQLAREVKAATYHCLTIQSTPVYSAYIVFDV